MLVPYTICLANGCVAATVPEPTFLRELDTGKMLSLEVVRSIRMSLPSLLRSRSTTLQALAKGSLLERERDWHTALAMMLHRQSPPHRGEDHKGKSRINPMQSGLRVHRSSRCGALFSCSICVAANWRGALSEWTRNSHRLFYFGESRKRVSKRRARLPPQCRGRASTHSYCPSGRLAMVPRASDSGRSASPVIGRAFRSGSLLHISGLSAWAVASG